MTAAALIANFAELGACSGKQAAMLAGLAPIACDSGERIGHRAIKGGRRRRQKRRLHGCSLRQLSQRRSHSFRQATQRQAGKPAKVVLVAVMRKLIILANTLINQNRLWSPIAP